MSISKKYSLAQITTFQDQGEIEVFDCDSLGDLQAFIKNNPQYYLLGKGSNLLINPDASNYKFIRLNKDLFPLKISGEIMHVGAGTSGAFFLKTCKEHNVSGLEFCAGVPTTIGGMTAMNFGAYGSAVADFVQEVHAITPTGQEVWLDKSECGFDYRTSIFLQKKYIILQVVFKLKNQTPADEMLQKRKGAQPLGLRTFGSIFKNPREKSAGQILDELGYKGKIYKNLQIWPKHANFMINLGGASFQDIIDFIKILQADVFQKTGINLEPEVQIV